MTLLLEGSFPTAATTRDLAHLAEALARPGLVASLGDLEPRGAGRALASWRLSEDPAVPSMRVHLNITHAEAGLARMTVVGCHPRVTAEAELGLRLTRSAGQRHVDWSAHLQLRAAGGHQGAPCPAAYDLVELTLEELVTAASVHRCMSGLAADGAATA